MKKKIWVIVGLVLVSVVLIAASYDYLLETGDKTVKSSECNQCHKIIYEEWAKDNHAMAYSSDAFKKASKNYAMQECLSCHAPQQIGEEKNLKVRPVNVEEGVNCTACHLKDNMIYGPYKLTAKHKSDQDMSFLKSEFCASCHAPTFQEWQASGSNKSCQECHMPRVERKVVQMGGFYSAIMKNRQVGQHAQSNEQLFKDAAQMTADAGKGMVKISVTNRAGGHSMPTGKYGDYRIVLKTQVKDADGKTIFSKDEIFSNLKKTAIPPQKTLTFTYPVPTETGKKYQVSTNLLYQSGDAPDFSIAAWNGEMGGGK